MVGFILCSICFHLSSLQRQESCNAIGFNKYFITDNSVEDKPSQKENLFNFPLFHCSSAKSNQMSKQKKTECLLVLDQAFHPISHCSLTLMKFSSLKHVDFKDKGRHHPSVDLNLEPSPVSFPKKDLTLRDRLDFPRPQAEICVWNDAKGEWVVEMSPVESQTNLKHTRN